MKPIAGSQFVEQDGKIFQGKHPVPVLVMGKDDNGAPRLYAPTDAANLEAHVRAKELGGKGADFATVADVIASLRATNEGMRKVNKPVPFPEADKFELPKPAKAASGSGDPSKGPGAGG